MSILSDDQYEAMAFVAACNRNHYNPTGTHVDLWRNNREPADAVYKTVHRKASEGARAGDLLGLQKASNRMLASLMGDALRPLQKSLASSFGRPLANPGLAPRAMYLSRRKLVTPAETMIEHLIRLTWLAEVAASVDGEPGLRLTDLGRALLRDAEAGDESEEEVSVVVLGREDPLAYPILVGQLAAAGPGLLVDPYLKLEHLHRIVVSTQLTRLLVSAKNNRSEIAAMQAHLGNRSLSRLVEVRSSTQLHDRVLMADDGDVLTVGTSLNGIGKTTTVMTPMPSPARESLRDEYERLWADATLVGPIPDEDTGDDDEESVDGEPEGSV